MNSGESISVRNQAALVLDGLYQLCSLLSRIFRRLPSSLLSHSWRRRGGSPIHGDSFVLNCSLTLFSLITGTSVIYQADEIHLLLHLFSR